MNCKQVGVWVAAWRDSAAVPHGCRGEPALGPSWSQPPPNLFNSPALLLLLLLHHHTHHNHRPGSHCKRVCLRRAPALFLSRLSLPAQWPSAPFAIRTHLLDGDPTASGGQQPRPTHSPAHSALPTRPPSAHALYTRHFSTALSTSLRTLYARL